MSFVSRCLLLAVVLVPSLSRAADAIFEANSKLKIEAGEGAGGEDLTMLYVTGGGVLYSIRTTTPGRAVWPK